MIKSSNPALSSKIYIKAASESRTGTDTMTIQGTVNKAGILLLILTLTFMYSWQQTHSLLMHGVNIYRLVMTECFIGLAVAILTVSVKRIATFTAPIYAALEGFGLGIISEMFESMVPGIIINTLLLTFGVFLIMLFLYRSKLIKPTENFKLGVVSATGAIALVYIADLVMSLAGIRMPYIHSSGTVGILISVAVVGVAALNLVMDFDFMETGEKLKAPKYMEWYSAFALLVTLIWLYVEILRLLFKLSKK